MLEPVIDFIDRLVTQFSWTRLLLVIVLAATTLGCFALYELYTGHFELSKLERAVDLVAKIAEVKVAINGDVNLEAILNTATLEVEYIIQPKSSNLEFSERQLKALFSLLPWFIFTIIAMYNSKKGRVNALLGVIFLSIPFAIFGAYIPTFKNINVNFYVIPWTTFFTAICLIVLYQKKKKSNYRR